MTEEALPVNMAIYEIKITEIPDKEQPDFIEDLEKKIEVDILEVKHDDSLDIRNINYGIGFVSPKYAKGNDVIRVYIKALSDETASKEVSEKTMILDGIYEHLNERFDRIFQGIALKKEFYSPYSVKKTKNFGTTELENKPKWL